jgi:hypothetical protein
MKRIYDVAVKVGSYQKDGQDKARWQNVGAVLKGDDGNMVMLLERSFNPAGVPFKEGQNTIILSFFDVKDSGGFKKETAVQEKTEENEIPF